MLSVPRSCAVSPLTGKRLSQLEQRLGVQLLRRTTRRLELTPEGRRYLAGVSSSRRVVRRSSCTPSRCSSWLSRLLTAASDSPNPAPQPTTSLSSYGLPRWTA
jgi:DNA-binding transcriptional LysR family regulator